MKRDLIEEELHVTLESIERLKDQQEVLLVEQPSLEGYQEAEYIELRKLQELSETVSQEAFGKQEVKDVLSAIGRAGVAAGVGFLKAVATIHRWIDSTHLVRVRQLREQAESIDKEHGEHDKGRMERARLAAALSVGGEFPADFDTYAKGMVEFSQRATSGPIGQLAAMNHEIAKRLEAKRWMGLDAFNNEVSELTRIIGSNKLPMELYPLKDFQRLFPGNRSMFSAIKPRVPRRTPPLPNAAARKVYEAVTTTTIGINRRPDVVSGKADPILHILTVPEALDLIGSAETILKEAQRVSQVAKSFGHDKVPSTLSMMLSGLYHGIKRQLDDMRPIQSTGFDVIEGTHQGGATVRHSNIIQDRPERNPRDEAEHEQRSLLGIWVSRYLKMSLVDHHAQCQSLMLLLIGVAKAYLDYAEESLDYYS